MAKAKDDTVTIPIKDQKASYTLAEIAAQVAELSRQELSSRECSGCANWVPLANGRGLFGQCMLSGKSLASPIITTDTASCSGWVARAS